MKRLQGSVFAVGLLMSVSVLLHAQEARITVPLGWYSLPEFAQALSTPERTVTCRSDLSQRVALVHLKERSWEEVRALVQEIGLRLEPSGKGRWRLEWLPSVEMRERRWRTQIAQAQDRQLMERMRLIREKVPVLPEKHWDEFVRLSWNLDRHLQQLAKQDTESERFPDAYEKQLKALDLEKWAIPPEVMSWVRQVAQLPRELSPLIYDPEETEEYRVRTLLTSFYYAVSLHLWYLLARLWEEPPYRLSFLEAYEQGFSLRVVPLPEALERAPEVRFLAQSSFSDYIAKGQGHRDDNTTPIENFYLVYSLHANEAILSPRIEIRILSPQSDFPNSNAYLDLVRLSDSKSPSNGSESPSERSFWSLARRFYQPVWQEARSYVEQAQRATETALQHPALQQPFEAEGLTSASWSRWVYQWAKQTGNEVLMLLNPAQDPVIPAIPKPTLAELYRTYMDYHLDLSAWLILQVREGVLIADVLNNCIIRFRDYPLASLKQLCARWDALEYKDYVEYYRSVSPKQNRWWFMGVGQWSHAPFGDQIGFDSHYTFGPLWFGIHLLEKLPTSQRNELFQKEEVEVDLMDLPEAERRELVKLMREATAVETASSGGSYWHPHWLLVKREEPPYPSEIGYRYIGDRPLLVIRAERVPTGEGKSRLRLRFAPNPKSAIRDHFELDVFKTPHKEWQLEGYEGH